MASPMASVRTLSSKAYKSKSTLLNGLYHFSSESSSRPHLVVNNMISIDPNVLDKFKEASLQDLKKHPGRINVNVPRVPDKLHMAVNIVLKKYPLPNFNVKAGELVKYLWSRKMPADDSVHSTLKEELVFKYVSEANLDLNELSEEEYQKARSDIDQKVTKTLRQRIYNWKPVKYDAHNSMSYMIGRLNSDYAVMYRILSEIATRDPSFKPKTMFDFGSGVGSSLWAVNSVWKNSVCEHYCVDPSSDMNTLARLLLQGGEEDEDMCFQQVYFRQFFPASTKNKYDLVLSAFTLMEQPSKEERLKTLFQLWEKTENYMIVVENGTFDGFTLVSEARDLIQQLSDHFQDVDLKSHVFAPCPHDMACPRGLRKDGTPCNFESKYFHFKGQQKSSDCGITRFSYIVLKKGERDPSVISWPRIVRETSKPSKRVQCRTCAANGELQVSVITAKKNGKELYHMARACTWGDLLPVIPSVENTNVDNVSANTSYTEKTTKNNSSMDMSDTDDSDVERIDAQHIYDNTVNQLE